MLFSYWLRLVCLVLFSVGLIQTALALLLQLATPALDKMLARLSARWQERACFAVPVVSHLAAFLLAAAVIAPEYIHSETNLLKERVGIVCIAGALLVAARYAYALLRAIHLMRSLPPRGDATDLVATNGVAVRVSQSESPLLAVAGLFSPRVIVSRRVLDGAMLSPAALEIALAHEIAHLRHLDNLKLFVLSSLALPARAGAALRRWRRAAEIAADDEAVAGSRARAILLAETLLIAARSVTPQPEAVLALGLLPHEEDLENRIHRLLGEETIDGASTNRILLLNSSLLLLGAVGLLLPLTLAFVHGLAEFAESVLHLG